MIIVIDAYNVLKQVLGTKYVHEPDKEKFIAALNKYGNQKGHAIILVFDGGPYEWPSKERVNGIYVVHSGVNENADAWIKQYMTSNKSNDVLLVSTDRELGRFVSRVGVQTMDALDFYEILHQTLQLSGAGARKQSQQIVKVSRRENEELDSLMQESSKTVPQKADDIVSDRDSKAHRHSKKERKILQKLKKL